MKHPISFVDFRKSFTLLAPFIKRYRKAYLGLFFLLFINIFLTLAFAWFFGHITEAAIHSDFHTMKWLVPLGISFVLINLVSNFFSTYLNTIAINGVKRNLKDHLLKHILRIPMKNASSHQSGELLSHFNNDVNSIDGVIGDSLINLIRLPLIFIVVLTYLVHINWKLSLINLLIAPVAVICGIIFGLLLRRNSRKIHSIWGTMNSLLNETFQGFHVIRSFTMETLMFQKYANQNKELYALELENAKLSGLFQSGGQLASSVTYLASLCLGAYYVSTGIMAVGALLTFVMLVNHLIYPLTGLAGQWAGFQRSLTAVERLVTLLEQPTDTLQLPSYIPSKKLDTSIQFRNVTFCYEEHKNVLERINLHIPARKVIAIVGPSGAGKSTLFHLLQGFYTPQSGQILIDGIPTTEIPVSELRSTIAHVPQESFLFAGTIRENLLYARPDITETEMIEASIHANIHDYIRLLPDGYDTEIGERGILLSGGQKQRIAIARAILKDAPILLLDEATSSLDNETEFHVKEALDRLMKDRTTIVIAHRLSTIQNADWIIVMEEGNIVQMGRHEELMNRRGLYQALNQSRFQIREESPLKGTGALEYGLNGLDTRII